ncbi:hypothetical protein HHL14_24830 [Paraburkholderia sp. G-4-1-8]|uniref:Uncharacterized protein n=1 Tax=Paraburkholderia antibiotica TaxID=2728839 RepID=A0A7Y0A052_9BURK|nr:hypothetical protein [Paraburkholderia antibiotica]
MASSHAALYWQYENVNEMRTTCAIEPEGRMATEEADAEILPLRQAGKSILGGYNCYCPRS